MGAGPCVAWRTRGICRRPPVPSPSIGPPCRSGSPWPGTRLFRTNPDQDPDFPQGLDVISPSWFVVQPDGEVENNGSVPYVQGAHRRGAQVWALVHNGFKADRTSVFLNDPRAVARTVARLAAYVELLDLDGINLDFENIADRDRDAYSAFVARVAEALHLQGRKVSVDVTVLSNKPYWSTCYDRKALGELVGLRDGDDLRRALAHQPSGRGSRGVPALGGAGGSVPAPAGPGEQGPPWGLPFYTREWEETPPGGRGFGALQGPLHGLGGPADRGERGPGGVAPLGGAALCGSIARGASATGSGWRTNSPWT